MPGALQAVDSYLIKIGWANDAATASTAVQGVSNVLGKLKDKSDAFTKKITSEMQKSVVGNFALGTISVGKIAAKVTFMVAEGAYEAAKWLFKMVDGLAKTDLQAEKLSRRWGITEQAARSYTQALKVMGTTTEGVWQMTDEEFVRFQDLQATLNSLEPNKDFQQFALTFRDISYQASKFNAQLERLRDHFAGAVFVSSKGFFLELKSDLAAVNSWMTTNGARIAQKAGKFFSSAINFTSYIYNIGKKIFFGISAFEAKTSALRNTLQTVMSPIITAYAYLEDILATIAGEQNTYLNARFGGLKNAARESMSTEVTSTPPSYIPTNEEELESFLKETKDWADEVAESTFKPLINPIDIYDALKNPKQAWDNFVGGLNDWFVGGFNNPTSNGVASGAGGGTSIMLNQTNNVNVRDVEEATSFVNRSNRDLLDQAQEINPYS